MAFLIFTRKKTFFTMKLAYLNFIFNKGYLKNYTIIV